MSDALGLLAGLSPQLKVGWSIWAGAGVTLMAWWWMAKNTPRPVDRPVAKLPTFRDDLRIFR